MSIIRRSSVIDTINENTPPKVLSDKLGGIINDIWRNGLTEEHFYKLIKIFIQNDDLDLVHRKLILECLVPQFVVDKNVVNELLLWYLSMYLKDSEASAHLMSWIAALIECKLMETSTLEKFYGQLAATFQAECLINPLSRVLMLLTNERTVNKRTAFLIQQFYKYFDINDLKLLLWEIKKYHPLDITFKSQPKKNIKISDFERALMKSARKQGIQIQIDDVKNEKLIPGMLPESEYYEDFSPPHKELTRIENATELGHLTRKLWVELPNNPVSLLGSKIGMIYLELFGPNEEFLVGLEALIKSHPPLLVFRKLSELQNRLRHGLPIVTHYLAHFLITWDGIDEPQLVYDLIKWSHFDDFDDLDDMILVPLSRMYICSNVDIKVGILNALSNLLINMVSVHMERLEDDQNKLDNIVARPKWLDDPMDTFSKVCSVMDSLILTGLMMEGLDSSSLVLEAIKYYNIIINLQLEFKLICFITPLPPVLYSALTSLNNLVISEVCLLIMRYKKNVIPFISSLRNNKDFSIDIDLINQIADDIFNYLWLGKDISGAHESSFTRSEKVRKHPGVFPLIEFLSRKLKINPKKLKPSDLLLMLSTYSEGLGEFIKYMVETSLNNSSF